MAAAIAAFQADGTAEDDAAVGVSKGLVISSRAAGSDLPLSWCVETKILRSAPVLALNLVEVITLLFLGSTAPTAMSTGVSTTAITLGKEAFITGFVVFRGVPAFPPPGPIVGVLGIEGGGRLRRGTGLGRLGVPTPLGGCMLRCVAPLPVETFRGVVLVRVKATGGALELGVRGPLELVGDDKEDVVNPGGEFD